uniref:Uncharacterized protein n=1 Tax=Magnetococcus massalia (strain MO-1) TaxID=451514 RepID=A0A1S7LJQ1_MAGMO|nr:Conserved exported protein of unknown function [Candidatus Magnetococcus massalia]
MSRVSSLRSFIAFSLLTVVLLFSQAAHALTPKEVLGVVQQLRSELEVMRGKIGAPKSNLKSLPVIGVKPREVFFQAESLELKIVDLVAEQTGQHKQPLLMIPKGKITPGHVFKVLESALKLLREGKQAMGVSGQGPSYPVPAKVTPTDVYKALILAHQQINRMLKVKILPSDVFQRVEQVINYTHAVNGYLGKDVEHPLEKLDLSRKPSEVYTRLLSTFRQMRVALTAAGFSVLDLAPDAKAQPGTVPGDVYDLASLLLTEISMAYFAIPNRPLTPAVYYAGPKKPQHVYQIVGRLEHQLKDLQALVKLSGGKLKP